MVSINDVFAGNSLKAQNIGNRQVPVIISGIEMKEFDDGRKLIIHFQGKNKVLICNKTNANRIAFLYGEETDTWVGREITLHTEMVDFKGEFVPAIRVLVTGAKPIPPSQPDAPLQNPTHPNAPPADGFGDIDDEIPF